MSRLSGRRVFQRYVDGDPLVPPIALANALREVGDDVLAGYSFDRAFREFLRRKGLDELVAQARKRQLELFSENTELGGTIYKVVHLMGSALEAEQQWIAKASSLDVGEKTLLYTRLDMVPHSPGQRMRDLTSHNWNSTAARALFDDATGLIGRELLELRIRGMSDALASMTGAGKAALFEMLAALNVLLEELVLQGPSEPSYQAFLGVHGRFFPEAPELATEFVDMLAHRAAAGRRALGGLDQVAKQHVREMSRLAFGDGSLRRALQRLDDSLIQLRPRGRWRSASQGCWWDMDFGAATSTLEEVDAVEDLIYQLSMEAAGSTLRDVNLDELERILGPGAVVTMALLRRLEHGLKERLGIGGPADQFTMGPRAIRELGRIALADAIRGVGSGDRDPVVPGIAARELSGSTRQIEWGDALPWDIPRTLLNRELRRSSSEPRAGMLPPFTEMPVHFNDIEVQEQEDRQRAVIALLVDTSFSMAMDGRWVPMKKTALALHTYIRSRHRRDALEIIAFGRQADVVSIDQLAALDANWDKGTNLHHALLLANRHFRRHRAATPILLIVTDGEPTSHLEPGGDIYFAYPPHPLTVAYSVRELDTAQRLGARTTFFHLGDDPGLTRFVGQLARRVGGRVAKYGNTDLSAAVLSHFQDARRNL